MGGVASPDMSDGEETGRISFTGRWDFEVRDEAGFLAYVTELVRQRHGDAAASDPQHLGDVNSALDTLLSLAPDPPGLERAGSGWSVEWIDRTLFEMSDDERDSTGF
jgi:hypothetical protein